MAVPYANQRGTSPSSRHLFSASAVMATRQGSLLGTSNSVYSGSDGLLARTVKRLAGRSAQITEAVFFEQLTTAACAQLGASTRHQDANGGVRQAELVRGFL